MLINVTVQLYQQQKVKNQQQWKLMRKIGIILNQGKVYNID